MIGQVLRRAAPLAAVGLLAVALAAPREARAYSVDGKLGVGFEQTLTALDDGGADAVALPDLRASGFGVWGWIGNVGWEAVVGARAAVISGKPLDLAGFIAVGGHYNVFRAPRVNLSLGARALLGMARSVSAAGEAEAARLGAAFELPLRVVYFFADQFSIQASVGPTLAINGDRANPLTGQVRSTSLSLFRGGFSGGLGFTVWLR
jgi:hypothetical protein